MGSIFESLIWIIKLFFKVIGFCFKWIGWYLSNLVDVLKEGKSNKSYDSSTHEGEIL